ncbi:C-type natriuretic peptide-like [Denticeps clupeoides]|uniref:Uncharacterized protein n=1 Tax=Denticeps clupeoides TaxID=299321 RepID=A0AAY4ASD4_9TELE|nr:C-type natriuretic peptide 2-like [Denticeps clupeoides]
MPSKQHTPSQRHDSAGVFKTLKRRRREWTARKRDGLQCLIEADFRHISEKRKSRTMLCSALLCVLLLLLNPLEPTETRAILPPNSNPNHAMQFIEQVLDRYNDLLSLDDLENLTNDQPKEPLQVYSSSLNVAENPKWIDLPPQSDSTWLRLLRSAVANQKRAMPDRARRGWNRGCFGLKLDRIGSMSGLGC